MTTMEALQRREAAALALQRARKLSARRQGRLQRDKALFSALQPPAGAWEAASLAELEDAALRPGAVRQRLKDGELSPLGRWFLQLKQLERQDDQQPLDRSGANASRQERALGSLLAVLARDKRCFDVVYALGDHVQDVIASAQDDGDEAAGVNEVLCFSVMAGGTACRVTCLRRGVEHYCRTSWHVPRLANELQRLAASQTDVADVLRLVTLALEAK